MKVLYLNSGNLFGGIETLLVTIARHRTARPAMIPEFGACFAGRYTEALRETGVAVHEFGPARMSRPWQVWRARKRLGRCLRESRPDVVVCHGSWSQALLGPAVRDAGIPLVYWTHDRVVEPLPWQERWAKTTPPDFIIANSRYTAAGQEALYRDVPAKVIYCALAPPRRRVSGAEIEAFRKAQGTSPESTVILQVSRLDPHKGHRLHLEALGQLKGLNWVCWMSGAPQRPAEEVYLGELRAEAARLGILERMRFPGWQPEIDTVFEAADVFCQPNSGPEPFGLTYVEALYREKPVVTTAMAGALEVLTPECGRLTPPGDAGALAEALRELVVDSALRANLGAAGPARARFLCDPAARLEEVETCLRQVLRG
jgi:glycosyltransferase involved in cell wall biosynthesis